MAAVLAGRRRHRPGHGLETTSTQWDARSRQGLPRGVSQGLSWAGVGASLRPTVSCRALAPAVAIGLRAPHRPPVAARGRVLGATPHSGRTRAAAAPAPPPALATQVAFTSPSAPHAPRPRPCAPLSVAGSRLTVAVCRCHGHAAARGALCRPAVWLSKRPCGSFPAGAACFETQPWRSQWCSNNSVRRRRII